MVLFTDGYDVVLEATSLSQLPEAFQRLERALGPLVGPPGGPVVFNGEGNCWPFPHQGAWAGPAEPVVSGDYRPDYQYRFGNGTRLRGDQICDHWHRQARLRGRGASPEAAPLAPFPNSGAFIGRAGSLRRLFGLAAEVLELFGDFEDQALLYSTPEGGPFRTGPRWDDCGDC
ncbi:unnamed protein product [Prorocentrum cordatum]|uniref:Uncharacterized protein n=1 Tax=Prorocentrum cordatum TaxID=2364126 RepID=A0ABN9QIG1_9DINO|nr:unnamed protein product [Polarella glacialis]